MTPLLFIIYLISPSYSADDAGQSAPLQSAPEQSAPIQSAPIQSTPVQSAAPIEQRPVREPAASGGNITSNSSSVTQQAPEPGLSQEQTMASIRDPFQMPDLQVKSLVRLTELEEFPVDNYKLIGVLTGPKHLKAMIQSPDGKTFFVTERTKIGLHGGIIQRITPDAIQIREKSINTIGQEEFVESEIRLPAEGKLVRPDASKMNERKIVGKNGPPGANR